MSAGVGADQARQGRRFWGTRRIRAADLLAGDVVELGDRAWLIYDRYDLDRDSWIRGGGLGAGGEDLAPAMSKAAGGDLAVVALSSWSGPGTPAADTPWAPEHRLEVFDAHALVELQVPLN